MGLESTRPQMSGQLELPQLNRGEAPTVERSEEVSTATQGDERSGMSGLLELVLKRQNLQAALKRARSVLPMQTPRLKAGAKNSRLKSPLNVVNVGEFR